MIASPYGGVNIEEIAKSSPNYIYKDGIDITTGITHIIMSQRTENVLSLYLSLLGMTKEQAQAMAKKLGFSEECIDEVNQCSLRHLLLLSEIAEKL